MRPAIVVGHRERLSQHAPAQRIMGDLTPLLPESPVDQHSDRITPNELHFVRQTFDISSLDPQGSDQLQACRAARSPRSSSAQATAGQFTPRTTGTERGNGAISTANRAGIRLGFLLEMAGLARRDQSSAKGADSSRVPRPPREGARPGQADGLRPERTVWPTT